MTRKVDVGEADPPKMEARCQTPRVTYRVIKVGLVLMLGTRH